MAGYALRIAQGSSRPGRCTPCGHRVTWAILAQRGAKWIALVDAPIVLRTETGANDVKVEILAFDQIHRCPAKKQPRPAVTSARSAPPPAPAIRRGEGVHAWATPDRIAELRQKVTPGSTPKPPQPGRLF